MKGNLKYIGFWAEVRLGLDLVGVTVGVWVRDGQTVGVWDGG